VSDPFSWERIQAAYDAAADEYEEVFGDDLARLPLDRRMLERANDATRAGLILDIGCGTGSAGSYLSDLGARIVGVDLSLGMLSTGRRHSLQFSVCQGDMRQLPFREGAFAVAVAYYSIHNVVRHELRSVLEEAARVLVPRGMLLVATHLGEGEVFTDTFLGHEIATTGGTLYSEKQVIDEVSSAGFQIDLHEVRESLAHEHESRRIYLTATRAT
jgi:ubiquinone/menaquinone biosynthesis C-methylase UbiE